MNGNEKCLKEIIMKIDPAAQFPYDGFIKQAIGDSDYPYQYEVTLQLIDDNIKVTHIERSIIQKGTAPGFELLRGDNE